ncbi:pyruvate kinase-like protein [Pseudomassariella vexata]|uniref:Pyruvate kinase-like protein n=1 Tax=Pseudomassariella vexata TaxID=1141098 RepID=A0A1Y2DIZ8_9PEZI|nr:pyruvate kinase-like protein [Pseudomassariella vexata]ORY58795.1 pyruvate kinase-like protein [Pseudomassariella vexata]
MGSFIPKQDADIAPLPSKDVLLSLRSGKIRPLGGVTIRSAINKNPRKGKVKVTRTGLVGDEMQYEMHGGSEKALHQYCASHYQKWNEEIHNREHLFKIGGFGENLSTALLSEDNVCIGDKFRLGPEVIVEVSEPRCPCFKLNHRFEYKKASTMAQNSGRTGWYLRVLQEGHLQEGDEFELIERINPHWSISRVQKYLFHEVNDLEAAAEMSQLPRLGDETAETFRSRLIKGAEDMSGRLEGDRIPVVWKSYRLVEKIVLTPRVKKFVFEVDQTSTDIDDIQLGRFPHVRLQFGPNHSFSRAYSVVSGDMGRFELGVARDDKSRGGSIYLHDNVRIGNSIKVAKGHTAEGALRSSCIDNTASQKHVFIIGGIGVTAFLQEIATISKTSADLEIHYAVRSKNEAAYLNLLPPNRTTVYANNEGQRLDLNKIVPVTENGGVKAMIYCCGPSSLMEACRNLTFKRRYPQSSTHFEDFGGATTGTGDPFEAEIKSTGQVLQVPRKKSLLQILNDAGFEIESSCQVGNCGMCMVDYCKGEVEHRGFALEEEQKAGTMLSCVSRGKGRIIVNC